MKTIFSKIIGFLQQDERRTLLIILGLSLVLRLGFIAVLNPNGYYFSDTRHYDRAAKSLLDGNGFGEKYDRAPLYPIAMAGVYAVFGRSFVAMRIFESLLGVLLCLLVYQIARRYFRPMEALLAAGLAAIYPHFLLLVGILYPTHLFTVLLALSLYFLVLDIEHQSIRNMILSGLFAALAALTVPAIFFIIPFWIFWYLFRRGPSFGKKIIFVSIFVLVLAAVLSPWTLRNYHLYGRFTLVQPVPHTVLPNLDDLSAQEKEVQSGFQSTVEYRKRHPKGTDEDAIGNMLLHYLKHPVATVKYVVEELGHFWALYPDRLDTQKQQYRQSIHQRDQRMVMSSNNLWKVAKILSILVMLPVFILAIIGYASSRPFSEFSLLLFLTMFGLSIGYSLIYAEVRYRIPIEPYVLMFMAAGVRQALQWMHLRVS